MSIATFKWQQNKNNLQSKNVIWEQRERCKTGNLTDSVVSQKKSDISGYFFQTFPVPLPTCTEKHSKTFPPTLEPPVTAWDMWQLQHRNWFPAKNKVKMTLLGEAKGALNPGSPLIPSDWYWTSRRDHNQGVSVVTPPGAVRPCVTLGACRHFPRGR